MHRTFSQHFFSNRVRQKLVSIFSVGVVFGLYAPKVLGIYRRVAPTLGGPLMVEGGTLAYFIAERSSTGAYFMGGEGLTTKAKGL